MRKLYFGLSGQDVKQLQMKLEQLGYADFTPTTFFGFKTHIAVRKFQKDKGLPQNGIVGITEMAMLGLGSNNKTKSEQFFDFCMQFVDTDVTPKDRVDDDVACMETVDTLYYKFSGKYISGSTITVSTLKGLENLSKNPLFLKIKKPVKGAILVYATGTGNGNIKNGHIFISDGAGNLYSNNSYTGKFEKNYTDFTAKYRYESLGGYKPHYFMLM